MRFLFVTGGSPATVFPLAPLATTARNEGHDIMVASIEETMPAVAGAGLPGVAISSKRIREYITTDRAGRHVPEPTDPAEHMLYIGRAFGRLAADTIEPLFRLAEAWRPDVVIGGFLNFSANILANRLGVPHIRHALDTGEPPIVDGAAEEELAPELTKLGLDGIPATDMWIDICPPSVRPAAAAPAQPMRYIPCNLQRPLEPWMYTKSAGRRVLVTAGTKVSPDNFFDYLCELVGKVEPLGAELLVAAPDAVSGLLRERLGIRAGWLPMDVVARNCDLLVHHAGGQTVLTGMAYGVPQLLIPNMPKLVAPSQRLADYGAGRILLEGEDSAEAVAAACEDLLGEPSYRQRAGDLAQEIAAMPTPIEVLSIIEKMCGQDG